jgi:ketosteroid isomerase-like protein
MDTKEVAEKLVGLCKEGKNQEAIDSLYADDIVSVEAQAAEGMPAEMHGIDAVRGKNKWWTENHEVHSAAVKGPFANGDRFAVIYNYDVTPKAGPFEGKRFAMEEVAVYDVKDGKVVREQFFY